MNNRRIASTLAAIATFALASLPAMNPAQAATATANFQVNATVVSACTVSAATLNFGSAIDPTTSAVPLDATTSMSVTCTNTTPYTVALNAGVNAGGASNFSARTMKNGTRTLGYQLYTDTLHATVWGDATNTSSTVAGVGIGSSQSVTIYGRLPSLAGAVPGTYTDTVTVTVTY